VFDDPSSFADIVVVAEVIQTLLGLAVIAAIAAPNKPLPPGRGSYACRTKLVLAMGGVKLS